MTLTAAAVQFVTPEQVRDPDLNNCPCINEDEPDDDTLDLIIDEASNTITIVSGFTITGRRQILARPCRNEIEDCCACCGLDGIPLGDRNPVVDMVKIDGVSIAASNYALHDSLIGKMLVRLDPAHPGGRPQHWPSTQRRWLPDTEEHTFSVLYTEGVDSDRILVRDAALEMVCDMVTFNSKSKGAIRGATSMTMGNVSISLEDRETRVARLLAGELGPATSKMMGILAPGGRTPSMVWAPELTGGWDLNASFVTP